MNSISDLLAAAGSGFSPSAILKILSSDFESMTLETLFNTFIEAWMSFFQTFLSLIGQ